MDNEEYYFVKEVLEKRFFLEKHYDDIKTLAIGGSNIDYAINPYFFNDTCFNLGLISLDLFGMWHLLNDYGKKIKSLKNVIIRIGIFNPSFELIKTSERWRCFYYKEIFGIPYETSEKNEEYFRLKKSIIDSITDNYYLGYGDHGFGDLDAETRWNGHLKSFVRNDSQLKYLKLINEWCVKNKKRLICIITPNRTDYKEITSKSIIKLLKYYVREYAPYAELYSFYYDKDFIIDDFGDVDHLNKHGAEKISRKINAILNTPPAEKNWHLSLYLLGAFLVTLPIVRCFMQYEFIQKFRRKIQQYWI